MQKRKVDTHQDELNNSKNVQIQEEIEVEKEEVEKKRIMFLTKHHNNKYRRSKKKCWCCKSTQHFKKNCPKLKCFYCKKRGHLKAHCFQKQIFELLKKMGMMIKKKEEKKKEKKRKKEEKKKIIEIHKLRAQQSEFRKIEDKWILEWKGTAIGDYIGPSTPLNTNEMRKDTFRWEPIDVLIKKRTALQKIPITRGFSNVCG